MQEAAGKKIFIAISCVAIFTGSLLFGCKKTNEIKNDSETEINNPEIKEATDAQEQETIEFLMSEAEKYAKNTIRKVGKTIYLGKIKDSEYHAIICVNEKNTRGMSFIIEEENGVGIVSSQGYYECGYPADEHIKMSFQHMVWE